MARPPLREQKKKHTFDETDLSGYALVRVRHHPERKLKKRKGVKGAHYTLKCGCCNKSVTIYYDKDSLEINGVGGSLKNWRAILLPLLGERKENRAVEKRATTLRAR